MTPSRGCSHPKSWSTRFGSTKTAFIRSSAPPRRSGAPWSCRRGVDAAAVAALEEHGIDAVVAPLPGAVSDGEPVRVGERLLMLPAVELHDVEALGAAGLARLAGEWRRAKRAPTAPDALLVERADHATLARAHRADAPASSMSAAADACAGGPARLAGRCWAKSMRSGFRASAAPGLPHRACCSIKTIDWSGCLRECARRCCYGWRGGGGGLQRAVCARALRPPVQA